MESPGQRQERLRSIWKQLSGGVDPHNVSSRHHHPLLTQASEDFSQLTRERAKSLSDSYWQEVMDRSKLDWDGFLAYVDAKEAGKSVQGTPSP